MGRKYGALHIRAGNNSEKTDAIIESCINAMNSLFNIDMEKAAGLLDLNLALQQIPLLNQLIGAGGYAQTEQKVVRHNGFVSIYDRRMTFENIQTIALKLSDLLNLPVFFSSVFDDDVFVFGLCENGKDVSTSISGSCEVYGLKQENDNIDGIERYLSNAEDKSPELKNLSGAELENALSKMLGFRLYLDE